MTIFKGLFDPIMEGAELITLTRYIEPEAVLHGIAQEIVPLFAVLANVPIVTGAAKLPAEFESWAVYIFPAVKGL